MAAAMNETEKPYLRDGGDWSLHEDLIIGNEDGLRNLRHAIDSALSDGTYMGTGLDQWRGVRLVDDEWILDQQDPNDTPIARFITLAIVVAFVGLFFLGVYAGIERLGKMLM
jgi:hypothetical protein